MKPFLSLLTLTLTALPPLALAADNNEYPSESQPARVRPKGRQGTLEAGAVAPDFMLQDLEGKKTVKLSDLQGKPVVLIFGSCTCPPFVASTRVTDRLYAAYKDRVHFLLVYIREAHPTDGRVKAGNQFVVKSPKTTEERRAIAQDFAKRLNVSIPILVDTLEDRVEQTYACWPNRMYILDAHGKIADKGMAGPDGTITSARRAPDVLDRLLQGER